MKHALAKVDAAAHTLGNSLQQAERQILRQSSEARRMVFEAIDACLAELRTTGLLGREIQMPSNRLWEISGKWLRQGALQARARDKPLGYAGDYVMLTQIFDRAVTTDPLGALFDEYFQSLDAPEAVRQRLAFASEELRRHERHTRSSSYCAVIVGSGAAIEAELAIRAGAAPAEIRLLDLDQAALDAATARLSAVTGRLTSVVPQRENLYRLPGRAARCLPGDSCDFLICLGLFDYLNDEDAVQHLHAYWNALRRGGTMLIGNFSIACESRTYMEWIGAWFLLFRSAADLERLAAMAGISPEQRQVVATENGVNLLLRATKPS
ncbi:MAG: class I SAM-dependent methyltransferase [Planctomycetales bacterium]|nr:class I SAM-dependent methyltransferase [Planctomycetales bacterium]